MPQATNEEIKQIAADSPNWATAWNTARSRGIGLDQIAGAYGVSSNDVVNFANRNGVQVAAPGAQPGRVTSSSSYSAPTLSTPDAPVFGTPGAVAPMTLPPTPQQPATPTHTAPTVADAPTFTGPGVANAPTFNDPAVEAYNAAQHTIDPKTETVRGQLGEIIDENGILMRQAEAKGMDTMAARGLSNSSMAAGAAQGAVMDRAMPIASADASIYHDTAMQNLGYANDALKTNANAKNTAHLAGFQANVQASLLHSQQLQESAMAAFNANVQAKMATYSAQTQMQLTAFQANVQSSQQAFDAAVKIQQQMTQIGADQRSQEFTAAFNQSMASFQANVNSQMASYAAAVSAGELDYKTQASMELQMSADASKLQQLQFQAGADQALQKMKNDTSLELANIEAEYKTAMQSSDSAKSLYAQISQNITNIMGNPDIPAESKAGMVQMQTDMLRSGLAIVGSTAGQDFMSILDFTGGTAAGTLPAGSTASPGGSTATNPAASSGWDGSLQASGNAVGNGVTGANTNGDDAGVGAGPR